MKTLAIRAPNWVGDLVMATPVLEAAVADLRFERVDVLVRAHLAPILADGPLAQRVVALAKGADECALYRQLQPDAILLLSNSFGAAWRAFRAGIALRAGARASARDPLLTYTCSRNTAGALRLRSATAHVQRDIAGLFGIRVDDLHPRLYVRDELVHEERARLERLGIGPDERYVVCCPGAAFGAAKLWPPERFAAVLDALHEERGLRAVVSGGPGEEALCDAVARHSRSGALSLAREPRDLERLKALVSSSALVLVGDSGPRWYAAAFDVPCVSVMGPNLPELTATALGLARIVRVEGLECSPCGQRRCPLGHHRCMRELAVGAVLVAARDVLARSSSGIERR